MNLSSTLRTLLLDSAWCIALMLSLPWLAWRFVFKGKSRRGWEQKLFGLVPRMDSQRHKPRIWFHAVSVGEVHLLKTLVDELLTKCDVDVVVSSTTETGFDRARELFADRHSVFFFPFDFSWAIRRVLRRIQPSAIILMELELWPNLIHVCRDQNVPVLVANGRLSRNSFRNYSRFGRFTLAMFSRLSAVAAQDEASAQRFIELGCNVHRTIVTGNIKYDSISTNRNGPKALLCRQSASEFGFADNCRVMIAGSTQLDDEIVAVEAWCELRQQHRDLKLVLVPRHPQRVEELEAVLKRHGFRANRRSKPDQADCSRDVLIVDVIGELSGWWALADIAFVGGSMGSRGGQNMIEPAAYAAAVCFGPNTSNFKFTVDGLLKSDAAKVVRSANELFEFGNQVLCDQRFAAAMGSRAQAFVLQHQGAASRTVDIIARSTGISIQKKSVA